MKYMEKRKKLKPGQLCTIIDNCAGGRCILQAKRYPNDDDLVCATCKAENSVFYKNDIILTQCPLAHLRIYCCALFDPTVYPKIIKYVKKH